MLDICRAWLQKYRRSLRAEGHPFGLLPRIRALRGALTITSFRRPRHLLHNSRLSGKGSSTLTSRYRPHPGVMQGSMLDEERATETYLHIKTFIAGINTQPSKALVMVAVEPQRRAIVSADGSGHSLRSNTKDHCSRPIHLSARRIFWLSKMNRSGYISCWSVTSRSQLSSTLHDLKSSPLHHDLHVHETCSPRFFLLHRVLACR